MSAVAAIASKEGIVLLSDGITFWGNESSLPKNGTLTRKDCKIRSTDTSKIIKINNQVGVQWVGNMMPDLQDRFKRECREKGISEPAEISDHLSKLLKQEYRSKGIDISSITGTYYNVNIAVTGFDRKGTPWGISITSATGLNPVKHRLAQNGPQTTCIIPFINRNNPFDELLAKHNKRTTDPRECATAAFTEMIRDYEDQGMIVGGEIFCEVLRPKKQSKFNKALMN